MRLLSKSLFFVLTIGIVGCLGIANVVVSSRFSNTGDELKALEQEQQNLRTHADSLEQDILKHTALINVEDKAVALGFGKPDSVITIVTRDSTLALSQ